MNNTHQKKHTKKENDTFPIKIVALAFCLTLGSLIYIAQTKEPVTSTIEETISDTIQLSDSDTTNLENVEGKDSTEGNTNLNEETKKDNSDK